MSEMFNINTQPINLYNFYNAHWYARELLKCPPKYTKSPKVEPWTPKMDKILQGRLG